MMMETDTLIMCIGNRDNGDDGIGPYIADKIHSDFPKKMVLDCGITPENYTAAVKRQKPKTLILIDAADMKLPGGEIRIIPKEKLASMHFSTHGIPLSVLIQYLEKEVKRILLIGIQPESMEGTMSTQGQKSADQLIELVKKNDLYKIKTL
jgi:hydrogenase 3 maturation protease